MWRDYLKLHFIIILWGFTAISGMWLSISPLVVVLYRTLIAIAGIGILLYWQKILLPKHRPDVIKMLLTGGLVALHWFLFFASARVSTASICLVGLASTSFWTSIFEPIITRRKVRWYELLLGGIMVAAMYSVSQFETKYWYLLGLAMGVGSALCSSLFTIINAGFTNKYHHFSITFYEMIGACITSLLLVAAVWGCNAFGLLDSYIDFQYLPNSDWGAWVYATDIANLLFLGIICTVYAYSASVELMRRIPPFAVNLSVNLEPVYGILLAAFLFGEWKEMSQEFYIAAVVILACVLVYPVLKKWDESRLQRR